MVVVVVEVVVVVVAVALLLLIPTFYSISLNFFLSPGDELQQLLMYFSATFRSS